MSPRDRADMHEDRALEEAAARLVAAADRPGGDADAALAAWLAEAPENAGAHQAVSAAWAAVGDIGSTPEMLALRRAALDNASRAAQQRWRRRSRSQAVTHWLSAAAVLLLVFGAVAAYVWTRPPPTQVYDTAAGERRIITLADDSKVSLDEGTRVAVTYTRRFRDLTLEKGQAEFDVATDPLRPFSVSAGGRRVVATGTLFNVDLLQSQLIVTLLHGSVVVAPDTVEHVDAGSKDLITLKPAQRLVVERATGAASTTAVDPTDADAWKQGKLVFDREPLQQALARVNRYARRPIVLAAPEQASQPISGVFDAGASAAFADAVSAQLPLAVEATASEIVLSRK